MKKILKSQADSVALLPRPADSTLPMATKSNSMGFDFLHFGSTNL
jgi:hypothetical protein